MKAFAILAIFAALFVTGCKTSTDIERIDADQFVVRDEGGEDSDGPNPEKGILQTCPKEGRFIESWRELSGQNAVLVTCGPKVTSVALPCQPSHLTWERDLREIRECERARRRP